MLQKTGGLEQITAGTVNSSALMKIGGTAIVPATTVNLSALTTNASGTLSFPTANALNMFKPYFLLAVDSRESAASGNVTYTLNINLSDADAGTTGNQDLSSQILATCF